MKRKIFSIFFALVLVCSFSLVTAVPVAAQVDRLVPDPYPTIQEAITAADSGDTIIVSDGTYTGDLVVNTPNLTLKSVNGRDETTIKGAGAPGVISVNAEYFTLGGEDGHGFTVIGNASSNRLLQSETSVIPNLNVSYNAFDTTGNPSQAVSLGTGGSNINISHNTFDLAGQTGIYVGGTQANVDDLIVDNNSFNGTTGHASWINFVEDAGGAVVNRATISNNTVTNAVLNMRTAGRTGALNEIAITGNTFKGGSEIFIGPGQAGIDNVVSNLSVTGNTVNADDRYDIGIGDCPFFEILGPTASQIDWNTVKVTDNNFNLPSSQWAVKNNIAGTTLDATNNWWGNVSGPTHSSNIGGTGALVSDNVKYSPWCAAVDNNAAIPGYQYPTLMTWGVSTNGNIQEAINDFASSGDTINVAAGLYNERLTINKSLDLRGARYGVDPTPSGARTTPADESIINITGLGVENPNVAVEIASGISNVSVAGFTLIGSPTSHHSDESIIWCWNDGIAIEDNIMDGYVGVLYKGTGTGLTIHRNRMVVNKNGVVIQFGASTATISNNVFTLGSTPAGDEVAIYMTGCSQSSVTGNTATGFINGRGLAGSHLTDLTVSGNRFTGNKDAISIWGDSTLITISNNVLSTSLHYGIEIKGQDLSITGNQITNNGDVGVYIDKDTIATERVMVSFNNIVDNANYGVWVNTSLVTETVDATNNWWGNASGPTHTSNTAGTGDPVTDNVAYSPWLGATIETTPMTFVELVTSNDPAPVTLLDEDDNTIATVDISGGNASSGTIAANSEPTDPLPSGTSLFVGTGKTGVVFLDVRVTGYTSGMAHITVPYTEPLPAGVVEETLGLYYWDEAAFMWRIAANSEVDTDNNIVSGDIPVSALAGTPIGMGGYSEGEATIAIESITNLTFSGNDIVDLTITTEDAQLGAVTIDLTFDNTVVEVLGGENSEFDSLTVNPVFGLQTARFVANQQGVTGVDATGVDGAVLAQVRLKAVGTTGSSSPLTLDVITLKDNDGIAIPYTITPGATAAIGGLGDANLDGAVDVYDCVYIACAIAGISGYSVIIPVGDVSGDGTVDAWDCTYLARRLAGIAGYN